MALKMIFEEFKEKLLKNIKNVICFKTFEKISLLLMFAIFKEI